MDVDPQESRLVTGAADGQLRVFAIAGGDAEAEAEADVDGGAGGDADGGAGAALCTGARARVWPRGRTLCGRCMLLPSCRCVCAVLAHASCMCRDVCGVLSAA